MAETTISNSVTECVESYNNFFRNLNTEEGLVKPTKLIDSLDAISSISSELKTSVDNLYVDARNNFVEYVDDGSSYADLLKDLQTSYKDASTIIDIQLCSKYKPTRLA